MNPVSNIDNGFKKIITSTEKHIGNNLFESRKKKRHRYIVIKDNADLIAPTLAPVNTSNNIINIIVIISDILLFLHNRAKIEYIGKISILK